MPTTQELIEKLKQYEPEARSQRVQLLITPSMYKRIKDLSDQSGKSVNEIINVALSEFLEGKE